MSKTPLSSQIIWLEGRVKELEAIRFEQKNELISIKRGQYFKENEKLKEEIATLLQENREVTGYYKDQLKAYHEAINAWSINRSKLEEENEKLIAEIKKLSESNDEFKKEFAKAKTTYAVNVYRHENEKLKKEINCLRRSREGLQNQVNELVQENIALKNSKPESDKIEDTLMDSLDARYRKKVEEMSGSAEGIYSIKRSAAVRLVEELVDEVIDSSYDDNQVKLAYAIDLLKRSQS